MNRGVVFLSSVVVCGVIGIVGFMASRTETLVSKPDQALQCGHWALLRSTQLLGVPLSVAQARQFLPPNPDGHSMLELRSAIESLGFQGSAEQISKEDLFRRVGVAIVHLKNPDHFVVMKQGNGAGIIIFDGAGSRRRLSMAMLESRFSGFVLFVDRDRSRPFRLDGQSDFSSVPSLQFETLYQDRGDIPLSANSVVFEFPVFNFGGKVLEIHDVIKDCSCISVEAPAAIEPMSSGAVIATFQHSGTRGNPTFEHQLLVTTNDPDYPRLTLVAAGNTDVTLVPVPSAADFGRVRRGESQMRRIFIKYSGEDIEVLNRADFELSFPDTEMRILDRDQFLHDSASPFEHRREQSVRGSVRVVELIWRPVSKDVDDTLKGYMRVSVPGSSLSEIKVPIYGTMIEE
jgi:hypothetical protein